MGAGYGFAFRPVAQAHVDSAMSAAALGDTALGPAERNFTSPVVWKAAAIHKHFRTVCPELTTCQLSLQLCHSRAQCRQACSKPTGRQVPIAPLTEPYATKTGRKPDRQTGRRAMIHLARAVQRRSRGWRGRG